VPQTLVNKQFQKINCQSQEVTVSGDPILALKTIDDQKERITLLLTDMVMPHLSGIELFRKAKKVVPSLKCILMSGYSQEISVNPDEILQGVTYIEKPFRTSRLLEIINETLKK
ncbi:MAG: response regulator, partial [Acidobacteriota bacterium]